MQKEKVADAKSVPEINAMVEAALPTDRLFAANELAKILNIHSRTVHVATAGGRLRAVRLGRSVRYDKAAVLEWMAWSTAKYSKYDMPKAAA
jgi:excisionase family DNA binding protein